MRGKIVEVLTKVPCTPAPNVLIEDLVKGGINYRCRGPIKSVKVLVLTLVVPKGVDLILFVVEIRVFNNPPFVIEVRSLQTTSSKGIMLLI